MCVTPAARLRLRRRRPFHAALRAGTRQKLPPYSRPGAPAGSTEGVFSDYDLRIALSAGFCGIRTFYDARLADDRTILLYDVVFPQRVPQRLRRYSFLRGKFIKF